MDDFNTVYALLVLVMLFILLSRLDNRFGKIEKELNEIKKRMEDYLKVQQNSVAEASKPKEEISEKETKDEIIAILRNFKEEFGERYGIEKLGLFGSVARGEQKEDSDIDICVKLQDPDYFTRMEIKESLEERFNAKVDVVSLTAIMRSLFRNHIEKDAIYI